MKPRGRRWFALWMAVLVLTGLLLGGCTFLGGPQAQIDASPLSGVVPLTVQFSGTGSTGSGGISTYTWDFGTGDPVSYEASGSYTYAHAGTFTLTLTVRAANGATSQKTVTVEVAPAVWITDEKLNRVYKLDMNGNALASFTLTYTQPRGITIGEVEGKQWLFVACYNGGNQRILRLDPQTGAVAQVMNAPAQSPLNLTYQADPDKRLWHVDGLSRMIYWLNPPDGQVYDAFGQAYFNSSSPELATLPFLWTPQGLDWTPETNASGYLWYLEGQNRYLYKIKIIPAQTILTGMRLQIAGDPVAIPVASASAIDMYQGKLWVVDVDTHTLIEVDPTTGQLTGRTITGFPGAETAGLEIQH
jgi:PKD repeat protein